MKVALVRTLKYRINDATMNKPSYAQQHEGSEMSWQASEQDYVE